MALSAYQSVILPAVESYLQDVVSSPDASMDEGLREMLSYHLGWTGDGAGPEAAGKRIRPLIVALTAEASGGSWEASLPAGAAVELLHNFSLIHDDIEDHSPWRRGRPTVWSRWGIPHAINAGDALFSLANRTILDLAESASETTALEAARLLQDTCLDLTRGQYLDLSYETRLDLTTADYWPMVGGKTAALLRCCTELGAILGEPNKARRAALRDFGYNLGLAFQARDDLLGIWGNSDETGKSSESDLTDGKKSLPILYGLESSGEFALRWRSGPILPGETEALADLLASEGAYDFTLSAAEELTLKARTSLSAAALEGGASDALLELLDLLLNRSR